MWIYVFLYGMFRFFFFFFGYYYRSCIGTYMNRNFTLFLEREIEISLLEMVRRDED